MIITQPPLTDTELFLAQNLGVILLMIAAFCLSSAWFMHFRKPQEDAK